jgi:hypothetical protein
MLVKWITHTFFRHYQDHGASTAAQSQCCHRIKWSPNIQLLVLHCQLMKTKIQSAARSMIQSKSEEYQFQDIKLQKYLSTR